MEITGSQKGRSTKTATVAGAESEEIALDGVLAHFGETRGRLEGWAVIAFADEPGSYMVHLYTH